MKAFVYGFWATMGVICALGMLEVFVDIDFSCLLSWRPE